ncbi:penicillin-binding protein 1C [Bordetella sp. 15P40C-2]|nr:penicillin-binding protein 1C [Bordetella sp. 15P40C-2]
MEPDRGSRPRVSAIRQAARAVAGRLRRSADAPRSGAIAIRWARAMLIAVALLTAIGVTLDRLFPPPAPGGGGASVVVAADGTLLRSYPSRDGVWRYPVAPDQVSPHYLETLLGYEDRLFYWHPGINPVALTRAAWQWLVHGRIVSGGSTITMQVARLLDPELAGQPSRSLSAKLRQMARALQLELHYTKDEILGLYLTHAPMGGIVEGVEMASRMWLGKSAMDLSPAEAALLTALPQSPSRLRPDRHPRAAELARNKVLDRMAALGVWSADAVADAKIENVLSPPLRARWLAPLAAERLQSEQRRRGQRATIVPSTLDAEIQTVAEQMLLDRIDALPARVSMAILVMDNDSLEIKAYAGSADFSDESRYAHVDMVRAVRSPGSTLKPFLYAQALEDGLIHSESMLLDAPLSFGGYAPGNFQAAFSGPVSVSQALQRSLNVPAVDLLDRVGPARFAGRLATGGIHLRMPAGARPNLSLILGGGGTTLEELVGAYRAFARDGVAGVPRLTPDQPRVEWHMMSPGAAWIVRDILEGGGHPDRPLEQTGRRLAWKTGTSFGFRDAWAVGVTDTWTIGVWVGRPDGTPNPGFFGANVAAPLLQDLVAVLPAGPFSARNRPFSVKRVVTCWPHGWEQGSRQAQACDQPRAAWALDDTVPPTFAGYADPAGALLRVQGLADGAVLRPVPGSRAVALEVNARGARGQVWWLLDGQVRQQGEATEWMKLSLVHNGRYTLTVMDEQGRHDRVVFEIAGVTP